jgi:hypothetical protein
MKNNRKNQAISELLGTTLLLGIAIGLFAIIQFAILSYPYEPAPPSVNIVGSIEYIENSNDQIILDHRGGESLELDTRILFHIGDQTININVGDSNYLDSTEKDDNKWGIGETLVFIPMADANPPIDLTSDKHVEVLIIDLESNSIIMRAVLQE